MKKLVHAVWEQGRGTDILQIWLRTLPTAKFRDLLLGPLQRYLSFVAAHQHSDVPTPPPNPSPLPLSDLLLSVALRGCRDGQSLVSHPGKNKSARALRQAPAFLCGYISSHIRLIVRGALA